MCGVWFAQLRAGDAGDHDDARREQGLCELTAAHDADPLPGLSLELVDESARVRGDERDARGGRAGQSPGDDVRGDVGEGRTTASASHTVVPRLATH